MCVIIFVYCSYKLAACVCLSVCVRAFCVWIDRMSEFIALPLCDFSSMHSLDNGRHGFGSNSCMAGYVYFDENFLINKNVHSTHTHTHYLMIMESRVWCLPMRNNKHNE